MLIEESRINISSFSVYMYPRPSKALGKFGNGRISISINDKPVWEVQRKNSADGIEWTWNDLLSFLVSNWVWLLNEQGLPYSLQIPDYLSGEPIEVYEKIVEYNQNYKINNNLKREIRLFCERHDLSQSTQGLYLPSIFFIRCGNQMLIASKEAQIFTSVSDARKILTFLGDTIYNWMLPFADDMTKPLLDAWLSRDETAKNILATKMHLLAHIPENDFSKLFENNKDSFFKIGEANISHESDFFAAARKSAGLVPIDNL